MCVCQLHFCLSTGDKHFPHRGEEGGTNIFVGGDSGDADVDGDVKSKARKLSTGSRILRGP